MGATRATAGPVGRTSPSPGSLRAGTSDRAVLVAGVSIGARGPVRVIAGPCSVEDLEQFRTTAEAVRAAGAVLLRGGAFKPRTSPYSFQGLGRAGLEIMRQVGDELGMGVVTEAMSADDVLHVAELADMIQIGARNMDNRALLEAAAETGRPVLLKRGATATVDELLVASDVLRDHGTEQVVLCERGSRTFEPSTRNSLDIGAVPELKLRTDLPVVVDPSHGTGRRELVTPVSLAGIAAGADGLLVEVHPNPDAALSDGPQSVRASEFGAYMDRVRALSLAVGRAI
ncbi:MAG: 3-deoxy-7-phosphoheptulonate synthase [Actinobacteria bacterium]|nr:3-deoxy-7-phosphoheptulonate synthase [Actinomycetota bacterium]